MKFNSIAVVGAGISGLLLSRELQRAGKTVVVLEKSRGVGGRMATKRVGAASFDQGAQFFTARVPVFADQIGAWQRDGLVAEWPAGDRKRYIGQPTMTAVPKALAEGLTIRREHKVLAAQRGDEEWILTIENQPELRVGNLLLTCPVPQALALLKAGGTSLEPSVETALARLVYHPCLALLVILDGPSAVPAEGVVPDGGPVRWLADNVKKGLVQGVPAAVTVHATPAFSAEHYGQSEAEIAALLLPAIETRLGARVTSATLHRWRFSEPQTTHTEPCVWLPELGLGFAGDAFGGPSVERAALSGLALARCIV